uniref:Coiled-coil domain containing 171 n=1 Tax=Sinocyclocheilus rhinocerous TaxID=307959 RepID=A0A673JGC0_9TELE
MLAGCVRGLRRQVCALAWQKAVLQEQVCGADVLRSEVGRLLQALGDGGVKGHGARRFRRCVIAVLAAGRSSLSQDVSRQLQQAEGRVRSLERAQCEQEQEVMCLVSASGMLAGCVRGLRRQVCALAWQKAVLQEQVCGADVLRSEVGRLLQALGDGGVKGHGARRFRRCVIAVLAAGRLRALGRRSAVMFRVALGLGLQPLVSGVKDPSCVLSVAQSACRKLLERLLSDVDSQCCGHYGKDSLARRLADGLHTLVKHSYCNSKMMMASLQKHMLEFTQRLHSAEVERRNLRLEISRINRTNSCRDTHTVSHSNIHSNIGQHNCFQH